MKQVILLVTALFLSACGSSSSDNPFAVINEQESSVSEPQAQTETQSQPESTTAAPIAQSDAQTATETQTAEPIAPEPVQPEPVVTQPEPIEPEPVVIEQPQVEPVAFATADPFIDVQLMCFFEGEPDYSLIFNSDNTWQSQSVTSGRVLVGDWDSSEGVINQRDSRFNLAVWQIGDGQISRTTGNGGQAWCGVDVIEQETIALVSGYDRFIGVELVCHTDTFDSVDGFVSGDIDSRITFNADNTYNYEFIPTGVQSEGTWTLTESGIVTNQGITYLDFDDSLVWFNGNNKVCNAT